MLDFEMLFVAMLVNCRQVAVACPVNAPIQRPVVEATAPCPAIDTAELLHAACIACPWLVT